VGTICLAHGAFLVSGAFLQVTPDFRYHVASLASIFLALGIGIAIGTGFVGAKIVEKQTDQITRLEAKYADLSKTVREKEQTAEALRLLLPNLVRGKLSGRQMVVLDTGSPDAAESAEYVLKLAGAETTRLRFPMAAWSALSEEQQVTQTQTLVATLLRTASEKSVPLAAGLLEGTLPAAPETAAFVLVGGTETNLPLARTRDVALCEALRKAGQTIVAVEALAAEPSLIGVWRGTGVATVDCIDNPVGQLALPFALTDEPGAYGLKATAERILPSVVTTEPTPTPAPSPSPVIASPAP
jgi:hypothetical protein